MLAETCVTIYNALTDNRNDKTTYRRTVIPFSHWEEHRGVGGSGTSHQPSNSITVFIPFSACNAMPGVYLKPSEYRNSPEKGWTLAKGDIIIKGVCTDEISSFREFSATHEDAACIVGVDTLDYGSFSLRHWEVTAE